MLTFAADLPEVDTFVVKDLDTVRPVVRYEDLLAVIDHHPIGELQVLRATKLVKDVARLIEDDDAHDFALHDDYAALVVDRNATWVLEDIGTKLTYKLAILVVNLDLK